jgi:tagaturonate epimerase
MLQLAKHSIGTGDRFGHQAKAQLRACQLALEEGIHLVPVWNKSNREHKFIGSEPESVRAAAECAVRELGWKLPWHVDADHINIDTVERFLAPSDFFTIDVADFIGKPVDSAALDAFVGRHPELTGPVHVPGIAKSFTANVDTVRAIAAKFLYATQEACRIYRHIASRKGPDNFITEVSMDETDTRQSPLELLVILAALADEGIPLQTIAPKFSGRFNKGVDYVGDVAQFTAEFRNDLAVVAFAIAQYGLPANLKLSVHTGSDKFSIYGPIGEALKETGAGVHLKTAGTSWLEELIGLAEAGGDGLAAVKEIYRAAFQQKDALCAPYATVIDIDFAKIPHPDAVDSWTSMGMAAAIRHDENCADYDPNVRQLLHVGFKLAAQMGPRYPSLLAEYEPIVSRNVTGNLLDRHIRPLWGAVRDSRKTQ